MNIHWHELLVEDNKSVANGVYQVTALFLKNDNYGVHQVTALF